MRLDHLLSKEQLAPFGVQQPVPARVWLAGGSWVEHLICVRQDLTWSEYATFGLLEMLGVGGGRTCTLLGPGGPGRPRWWLDSLLQTGWVGVDCDRDQAAGTDRTLRTTQWTRAS